MVLLVIDKREKRQELIDQILDEIELNNKDKTNIPIEVEFDTPPVGDYIYPELGVCIEHKEADKEYPDCLISGKMDTQIADICQYPHPYVFICGKWVYDYNRRNFTGFTQKKMAGSITSYSCRTDVKILHWESDIQFAYALIRFPTLIEKGEKIDIFEMQRHSKTKNRLNYNLNQYLSLPSIGKKRAEELYDQYKSFYNFLTIAQQGEVFNLPKLTQRYVADICGVPITQIIPLVDQFKDIPGIGNKTAEELSQRYTLSKFKEAVLNGLIKVNKKTQEWVEKNK